jgi:predicted Rossmann fold nucleotide-binding protein DprA/Smf involved in DNA uptake
MYEKKPYLDRNKDIVRVSIGLIAAPKTNKEEQRSGTWSTVRYATKTGKPLIILPRELKKTA